MAIFPLVVETFNLDKNKKHYLTIKDIVVEIFQSGMTCFRCKYCSSLYIQHIYIMFTCMINVFMDTTEDLQTSLNGSLRCLCSF